MRWNRVVRDICVGIELLGTYALESISLTTRGY
jgi:hypothetical protein